MEQAPSPSFSDVGRIAHEEDSGDEPLLLAVFLRLLEVEVLLAQAPELLAAVHVQDLVPVVVPEPLGILRPERQRHRSNLHDPFDPLRMAKGIEHDHLPQVGVAHGAEALDAEVPSNGVQILDVVPERQEASLLNENPSGRGFSCRTR